MITYHDHQTASSTNHQTIRWSKKSGDSPNCQGFFQGSISNLRSLWNPWPVLKPFILQKQIHHWKLTWNHVKHPIWKSINIKSTSKSPSLGVPAVHFPGCIGTGFDSPLQLVQLAHLITSSWEGARLNTSMWIGKPPVFLHWEIFYKCQCFFSATSNHLFQAWIDIRCLEHRATHITQNRTVDFATMYFHHASLIRLV